MLTSSSKILHDNKRDFFRLNGPGSDQRIRERWCDADFKSAWARLRRCLLKDSLKRHFLDIYLTTFSECVNSEIQNLWGSSFFWNHLKFKLDFKNSTQNSQKIFCFWDNCIWISIVKLSLLGTGYFSSAGSVLTSSIKICHVNKRDFFNSIDVAVINEYDKGDVTQISTMLGQGYHVSCQRVDCSNTF